MIGDATPTPPEQATPEEARLVREYFRTVPCACRDAPGAVTLWFVVDGQRFQIGPYLDTPEEAAWLAWQMAKALRRLMKEEQ